jgi:hypothetical protein
LCAKDIANEQIVLPKYDSSEEERLVAVKDYKELVATAEKSVAAVVDPALKQIAFQKILDDLLRSRLDADKKHGDVKTSKESPTSSKRAKSGPMAYIDSLISDGFFASRRTSADVLQELANQGHHISTSDAGVVLLRLCKAKKLRRKKEGKNYLYSNW